MAPQQIGIKFEAGDPDQINLDQKLNLAATF